MAFGAFRSHVAISRRDTDINRDAILPIRLWKERRKKMLTFEFLSRLNSSPLSFRLSSGPTRRKSNHGTTLGLAISPGNGALGHPSRFPVSIIDQTGIMLNSLAA